MEPAEILRFTEQNRQAWNAIAAVRGEGLQSAERLARGEASFDVDELPIPSWTDLEVLHLQCASGEDTLSLALAGARVTGVDIAPENIRHATHKAEAAGLTATFLAADVYQLPPELSTGQFDVVFVNSGSLGWLPDLGRWAGIIEATLKPGGILLVDEIHPLWICFEYDGERYAAVEDYFRRDRPQWNDAGPPGLAGTGPDDIMPSTVEFRWPLGDLITTLAQHGIRVEILREYPLSRPDLPARQQAELAKLPGGFVLLARKDRA